MPSLVKKVSAAVGEGEEGAPRVSPGGERGKPNRGHGRGNGVDKKKKGLVLHMKGKKSQVVEERKVLALIPYTKTICSQRDGLSALLSKKKKEGESSVTMAL